MTNTRTPFWLDADQFQEINQLIMNLMEFQPSDTVVAIHEELSIAKTRFTNGRYKPNLLARVLGFDSNSIPVRLSDREHEYVMQLDLSNSLKGTLNK
jgi:hypothetical protein